MEDEVELQEVTLELLPEDVETTPFEMYKALVQAALPGIQWTGYVTKPLGFGISRVFPTGRFLLTSEAVSTDAILEAALALSCVQSAQLAHARTLDRDHDPFDQCWFDPPHPVDGTGPPVRCGIVTTFRDAPNLHSWIRFHLAVGFCRIFLFVDNPDEDGRLAAEIASLHSSVTVVLRDGKLQQAWRELVGWSTYGPSVDVADDFSVVMARQCLNAEYAMERAEADDLCDWLLHIDADELLCPPPNVSVSDIICGAEVAGANGAVFVNYEVAPERDEPYMDPFTEATLFKVNDRLRGGDPRFLAYANGKSAVRVGGAARPNGVHKWWVAAPAVVLVSPERAKLLHFVNCGLEALARKYALLGPFADSWHGRRIADIIPFHVAARDAALESEEALALLYREQVLYDAEKTDACLTEGSCVRIDYPSRILASC